MANNRVRNRVEDNATVSRKKPKFNVVDALASWINSKVEIEERLSVNVIRQILWIMLLVIIYIFFQHNFEGLIRRLNKTERSVNANRAAYISQKSKYMYASKQSEIEKKLLESGFQVNTNPPIKIEVNQP